MSQLDVITGSDSTPVYRVRKIGPADLKDALAKGLADFSAKPSHLVFLGLIYPLVGIGPVFGDGGHLVLHGLEVLRLSDPDNDRGFLQLFHNRHRGASNFWLPRPKTLSNIRGWGHTLSRASGATVRLRQWALGRRAIYVGRTAREK